MLLVHYVTGELVQQPLPIALLVLSVLLPYSCSDGVLESDKIRGDVRMEIS